MYVLGEKRPKHNKCDDHHWEKQENKNLAANGA